VYATAVALTTGTFTPVPPYAVFATPTPTPTDIPLIIYKTPTPTYTPTPVPQRVPAELRGNILFFSNRPVAAGLPSTQLWALDPATGRLAYITDLWVYHRAVADDKTVIKPEGKYTLSVRPDARGVAEVFVTDHQLNNTYQVTPLTGMSYDPVWSPDGNWIAFVTNENGNDEIYLVDRDGKQMRRLTFNDWEWDKHPSFSPDGSQIVFFSNRNGRNQLWIMNADGSNQRVLMSSPYDDWAPVWVK
jgi:dipeptidyl aminopeptidase/acylaminoacyl peptidase